MKKLILFLFFILFTNCSKDIYIEITTPGKWSGAISRGYSTTESVEGQGYKSFSLGYVDYAGAVIQKSENNNDVLEVVIRSESKNSLVESGIDDTGRTTAGYGVVCVSHSYD